MKTRFQARATNNRPSSAVPNAARCSILAALRGYDLPDRQVIHAARCVRAAAHGFATLQAAGGFQYSEDLDTSFTALIRMLTDSLAHWT